MSTLGLVDKQSAGPSHALEQVLEAVLAASAAVPGGASAAARRGSRAILPAVVSLRELQRTPQLGHWHGLLHRRCRLAPARAGFDEPRAEADERAGWRLVRARVRVGADDAGSAWPRGADVVHDLTRRLGDAHGGGPPAPRGPPVPPARPRRRRHPPRAPAHPAARPTGRRVRPATPRPPAAGSLTRGSAQGRPRARSTRTGRTVLVRARDIAAWADAGGDSNRVHLVPGAARDAGLRAGPDDVVAHGLLLAAVSLALVPPTGDAIDLRMPAPLLVPARIGPPGEGPPAGDRAAALLAVSDGGDLIAGGRRVLRRGWAPAGAEEDEPGLRPDIPEMGPGGLSTRRRRR